MSSVSSREARRRKIKERGSDRLALITGRIQTLPTFADPSPPSVDVFPREESQAYPAELRRDDRGVNFNKIDVNPSIDNPEFSLLWAGNECKDESPILAANDVPVPSLSPPMSLDNPEFPLQKSWVGNECKVEAPILAANDVPEPSLSPPMSLDNPEFPLQKSQAGNECEDEPRILEVKDVPVPSLFPLMSLDSLEFPLQKSRTGNECEDEASILEVNDVPEPSLSPPVSVDNPGFPLQKSRADNKCKGEAAILELNNDPEPSLSSSASREVSRPVLHVEPSSSSIPHQLKSFSFNPSVLRSAVDHTVNARMLCSVSVAILVVLSYMGFPLIGGKVTRSVLMFRPLYLVLLTNITLVVAWMMLTQPSRNARSVNGEGKGLPGGDNDWVNQIGNNLELGYLLMKLMDAVVMDCSLYSAIVVCGTCLARLVT